MEMITNVSQPREVNLQGSTVDVIGTYNVWI